jgi:hypothetical protein
LNIAPTAVPERTSRPIYMVGIPARDARRGEPERIARIFRDVFNVKRVQPGMLYGWRESQRARMLQHDCGMLGHSGGSCLVDLETYEVVGLHVQGGYLQRGTAVPLAQIRETLLARHHLFSTRKGAKP